MAFVCNIPAVPTVQQDDQDIRISRWDFQPGAVTGWHTHGWPYFVIMLTDITLSVHNGTEVNEAIFVAGQSYHRPPGIQHDNRRASHASSTC